MWGSLSISTVARFALLLMAAMLARSGWADGSLDTTFDPNANGNIYALAVQPDGKIVVGGDFTSIGGQPRNYIARLNADGTLDTTFNGVVNNVRALAVQPDGKVLVGMSGNSNLIARLNVDGSADTTFSPPSFFNASGAVDTLALLPNGAIMFGGNFTVSGYSNASNLFALGGAGGFGANSTVHALAVRPNGIDVIVGGSFTQVGGQSSNRLAIVNYYTHNNLTYNTLSAASTVDALALQPDGKFLVSEGTYVQRWLSNGPLDTTFNSPGGSAILNGYAYTLALQLDGKVVVGGNFTQISGSFLNYIARLNTDGSLDTTFNPNANNSVLALALQPDGKLVIAGSFTAVAGQTRNYIARLTTQQAALQSLNIIGYSSSGSAITWQRSGAGPELAQPPQVSSSSDGVVYSTIGTMHRVGGGWRYVGYAPPLNQNFYLRAQGPASSGMSDGSSSSIQSTLQANLSSNDGIFTDGFDGN